MSFFNFLSRAFGAGDADVVEEFDDIDRPEQRPAATSSPVRAASPAPATAPSASGADASNEVPAALADAVLSIVNSMLPPVAARFVDPEAQRRWLASELGPALAEYSGDLSAARKEVSSKREEQKAALLSEQRQRRALAERNRDLENKINELDSEIEQHKLTISSLMNKIRIAELDADADAPAPAPAADDSALREEFESLRARLAEQDAKLAAADDIMARADAILADKDKEIADLAEKIAEFESAAALQQALEERRQATGVDADADETVAETAPRKRRGRPRNRKQQVAPPPADLDSSADLEEIDWLLPGGVPAGHVGHVSDPEFGYQPPKQTPAPDSDAQLTLF